jgi:tetratricopeptide (TPR) repeat protein
VQLIDSASDRHLWAKSYDHELKDVLVLQSSAARDIAEEVQGKVGSPPPDLRTTSLNPVKPGAYEDYLKGRYFWNKRTEDGLKKSIDYFEQAISQDPKFAAAYAGLAGSYSILGSDVLPARVASAKAHAAASKGLELDPTIAEGHAELGLVEFYYDWDWPRSEQEFRRAIELNPNYATAHQWYGYYLAAMGRFPEALEEARKTQQIDSSFLVDQYDLGGALSRSASICSGHRLEPANSGNGPHLRARAPCPWGPRTKTRESGCRRSASTRRQLTSPRTTPLR